MSTFDAGIGQIRGELNSYTFFCHLCHRTDDKNPLMRISNYANDVHDDLETLLLLVAVLPEIKDGISMCPRRMRSHIR
jgi:hypothetical protein